VVVNFSSYDYLGINGHPAVVAAALEAINTYGTSVSASRISAGERQVHRDLETALAQLHGVADAVSFVGGHATNVSVIGDLLGAEDLLVTDVAIHNSITEGAKLSGAKRILCQHGDLDAMERALRLNRARCRRALIVVEGLYSMDGDVPDLAQLIKLKRRYNSWLMVDEAHSCGVLGASGRGIAEEQNIDPTEVDIWMGTLSKSFVAGWRLHRRFSSLIELLRYTSPGFVFSVGQSPPLAAAAARCDQGHAGGAVASGKASTERSRLRGTAPGGAVSISAPPSAHRWSRSSSAIRRMPSCCRNAPGERLQRRPGHLPRGSREPGEAALFHHQRAYPRAD
jgi:7-keto-8-aminopelargonate synthetase-like enzyme